MTTVKCSRCRLPFQKEPILLIVRGEVDASTSPITMVQVWEGKLQYYCSTCQDKIEAAYQAKKEKRVWQPSQSS